MRIRASLPLALLLAIPLAIGCGDDGGNAGNDGGNGNGDGGNGNGDGGIGNGDGGSNADCVPGAYQCNDCIDNDDDGLIDGFDPHCAGPEDRSENDFSTGIPGDNQDPKSQDCFFDGNSGKDQPCDQIETCCLLGEATCAMTGEGEPNAGNIFGSYPGDEECAALFACYGDNADDIDCPAPVGCDCFSCCTICNPDTNACQDIYIGPGAPNACEPSDIGEDTESDCLVCTQVEECGGGGCDDDPEDCILCPGQDEDDLPETCTVNECPGGETTCDTSSDCGAGQYCAAGCCLNNVD